MSRQLPSLNAIRAFESAARHLSFTKAAEELRVTQGAISRQIALLESKLQLKLFLRHHRAIDLTQNGIAYFRAVRDALDRLEEATTKLLPQSHGRTLRIKLPPTLAIRWVVPRLARLHSRNREISVQITTSHAPPDFDREEIDVAIYSATEAPRGLVAFRLFGEVIVPVCSPAILDAARPLRVPADLAGHVLLGSLHRENDWPDWLAAAGVGDIDGSGGLVFENSGLAYQAAIDRLGVAIAQKALVAEDIASRRLVAPLGLELPTTGGYYLVCPRRHAGRETVRLFTHWILEESRPFRGDEPA